MKIRDNEQGSSLMMVLLLVLMFTILGLGMMSMNISAAKQFNRKEEQVQARHLAEMGVLHYKEQLKQLVKDHNTKLEQIATSNATNIVAQIGDENKKVCDGLNISNTVLANKPAGTNYSVKYVGHTGCKALSEVVVTIASEGWAGKNGKALIQAELTLFMPDNSHISGEANKEGSSNIPTPPNEVKTTWPCKNMDKNSECEETIDKYTDVKDEEITIKKAVLKFNDNLIINKLTIEGGNGAFITVAKDFYVKDLLSIKNHACIAVQGNLTVSKQLTIDSNGQIYIFVYGDAYLPNIPSKGELFVSGKLYINGVKQDKSKYQSVPIVSNNCTIPGPPIKNPNPSAPVINKWGFEDRIEAKYLK